MSSQKAWLLANRYSSALLFGLSVFCISIQGLLFAFLDQRVALISTVALWIVCLLTNIVMTEKMLKKELRD